MKRKTKIVCTVGPSIDSPEMISKMIDAGMNVARLNFSHANQEEHGNRIDMIRKVAKDKQRFIGIMSDTKGPEIRTGQFENGIATYKKGDKVEVCKEPVLGTRERFHIDCKELFDDITVGDVILIDDGKMKLTVLEDLKDKLLCEINNSGSIRTKKGVNIPNAKL